MEIRYHSEERSDEESLNSHLRDYLYRDSSPLLGSAA